MSLEQQVVELTARITALETQLKEIIELKGVPGPRGPAGDIKAAVINAEQAAKKIANDTLSGVQSRVTEACDQILADSKKFREYVQSLLDEGLKNAAENHCIQVLRDYHLLDENHAPTHWKGETRQQAKD
jgi:hypothetical protein